MNTIFVFGEVNVSPTFKLVITSLENKLLNNILKINKLNPKCAIFCEKLPYFLIKKSLRVIKNKYSALEIKIVFISKLELNFLTIKKDKTKKEKLKVFSGEKYLEALEQRMRGEVFLDGKTINEPSNATEDQEVVNYCVRV